MKKKLTLMTMLALCVCLAWSSDVQRLTTGARSVGMSTINGKLPQLSRHGIELINSFDSVEKSSGLKHGEFDQLYLVGAMQGWDISHESTDYVLKKVEEGIYSGKIWIDRDQLHFRLYGKLGDWESYSVGAASTDIEVPIEFDSNLSYTGDLHVGGYSDSKGKGNWLYDNWPGGELTITANLNDNTITFNALPLLRDKLQCEVRCGDNTQIYDMEQTGDGKFHLLADVPSAGDVYISLITSNGLVLGDSYRVEVGEKGAKERITNRAPYRIINYGSDKLDITVNLNEMWVKFFNPYSPFNPHDYVITFPDEEQTELIAWRKNIIRLIEPEGLDEWLEIEADPWAQGSYWSDNAVYNFAIIPSYEESITVTATSRTLREADIFYSKTFNVVEEDVLTGASETMYAIGAMNGFDANSTEYPLSQTAPGVYTGTVKAADSFLAFRFSLAYSDGRTLNFGAMEVYYDFRFGDNIYYGEQIRENNDSPINTFSFCANDDEEYFFIENTAHEEYKIIVNLNTHEITLIPTDFTPMLEAEETELNARLHREFSIILKSNIDNWDDSYVSTDNPDAISLRWTDYQYDDATGDRTFKVHMSAEQEGEFNVTITAPWMQVFGIEPITVHVLVKDFKPTSIDADKSQITIKKGEFDRIEITTEPFNDFDFGVLQSSEKIICTHEDYNGHRYLYILGKTEGEHSIFIECWENPTLSFTIPVTVLPEDASLAEHIIYTTMRPEAVTTLSLDSHADGCEANTSWSSSNPEIAEVNTDGTVYAKKTGKTVITADCGKHLTITGINVITGATEVEMTSEDDIIVYSRNETVVVCGLEEGSVANVYSANGTLVGSRKSQGTALRIPVGDRGAFLVTAGGNTYKVML